MPARPEPVDVADAGPPRPRWMAAYAGLATGFATPAAERAAIDRAAGRGAATYGELRHDGAARILRWLQPRPVDVLVDLGSGTGRFVVQAAATTAVGRAVGVELSAHRHAVAVAARRALGHLDPAAARRLELVRADLRAFDWSAADLVWFGSTCFTSELLAAVTRAAGLARGLRRLLTTQRLPWPARGRLVEVGCFEVAATWSERIDVHVYAPAARRGGEAR